MNLVRVTSPFVFDKPVPPGDLVGRDGTLAMLRDRSVHGRFMLLAAPRRYGKTSLVHRLAADGAATGDLHVVHVDLLGVQHVDDVTRRFARALRDLPTGGRLRSALEQVAKHSPELAATIGFGAVTVSARRHGRIEGSGGLEALLDLPSLAAAHLGAAVLVVLDEFQDIDGTGADATIRAVIQHQHGVAYLFAGSEPSIMEAIFSDRRRALYGQAERIELGPLPDDALGSFVEDRFAATGRSIAPPTVAEYLGVVGGHPQRAMLIAHHLWSVTAEGATADRAELAAAVDAALAGYAQEGSQSLRSMTAPQAKVARLVAHHEPVHGAAAARLELAKSSASQALAALRNATVLTGEPPTHIDPLLAEWLRRELPLPERR
jgi:uncharacterized protein